MQEELILTALKEIREDQKKILTELTQIKTDMDTSFNGYEPHEVAELLHKINADKERSEQISATIRKAAISWIVPIILASIVVGFMHIGK